MANIHAAAANNCSSSSSPAEPDGISIFLQQIFLRSASSSSSSSSFSADLLQQQQPLAITPDYFPANVPGSGTISVPESSSWLNSSPVGYFPASVVMNLSTFSVGTMDNDTDGYDCESEEAMEALVEEAQPKSTLPRNTSKRTRAAEVHNLSEKRRRSRINEKMKALQNLIPNSNKSDKASMLDEAIEYLKQLQLQVQMLTMRTGLSLYPVSLPGMPQPNQISQLRMGIYQGDGSLSVNTASELPSNQDTTLSSALFGLPDNCATRASVADFSTMIPSKSSFELASNYANGMCREELLPFQQANEHCSNTSLRGYYIGAKASSIPFDTGPSDLNANVLEACFNRGEQLEHVHLTKNHGGNPKLSPKLNCSIIGGKESKDGVKTDSSEF